MSDPFGAEFSEAFSAGGVIGVVSAGASATGAGRSSGSGKTITGGSATMGIAFQSGVTVGGVAVKQGYTDGASWWQQKIDGSWAKLVAGNWQTAPDPTASAFTESPDGAVVMGTVGVITDSKGAQWRISATGVATRMVLGATVLVGTTSASATELLYRSHTVYVSAAHTSGISNPGWWTWSDSTNSWTAVAPPV